MEGKKRSTFSGSLGFILAAAGSAVGLGNIWRFPYLAAKDGGGVFILFYLILTITFGFTLLTTEVALGRKTRQSPLTAYGHVKKQWKGLGIIAFLVPVIILPYYCAIGGWVFKYLGVYLQGLGEQAVADDYFTGFITSYPSPIFWMLLYFAITAVIIIIGVDKGIERLSKFLMPILVVLIVVIAVFSLTLSHTDASGVTRTGLDGLKVYLIPDFTGMTIKDVFIVIMDAMGQLFFSISVAMGIMVTYGSYMPRKTNLLKSVNMIEIFDTAIALIAGLMIIPAIIVFMGKEGMSAGPGLIFVSLPKVFSAMGKMGYIVGPVFFIILAFAAITSSVSIMEAIVSSFMDAFHLKRLPSALIVAAYSVVMGVIVCLGYNKLYFEVTLPNGTVGQILDVMDYISNNCLMPLLGLLTSVLIGWVAKPKYIIDEVTQDGSIQFKRKVLYIIMIKFVAPALLLILLLQSFNVF